MFASLSERLSRTLRNLSGKSKMTTQNIQDTLEEVRTSLLEADVAVAVVEGFCQRLHDKAVGLAVDPNLSPSQQFIKLVQSELVEFLGKDTAPLNFNTKPPMVILMAGLQGSGKTTTCAKLAKYLKEQLKKSSMLVSCDIYRPAAIAQLETVAAQVGAKFCPSTTEQSVEQIIDNAIDSAKRAFADVLIIDTAGRMHIDADMMAEIKKIHQLANPLETLFVVDSMTGQDAANTTKAFNDALPITGAVLTKIDGDSRGGAALAISHISGKPIKFLGVGEKLDALEVFHPDRIASRILGMGDVLTLIEEIERKVDKDKAEKLANKVSKGKGFDLNDLREQIMQMKNMGGMAGMLDKLPGMGAIPKQMLQNKAHETQMNKMVYIIDSMTKKERSRPEIILGSRKRRIADGSGTDLADVNRVLKQHTQMQKMMKKFKGLGGMQNMLRGLQGLGF